MKHDARAIAEALAGTTSAQSDASDPRCSAWVSANAGTGKTHVLTNRVLRLLLAGTPPERILCLTYTKAAAAEMSKRTFDKLAQWVAMPNAKLAATLADLDGRAPDDATVARARTLFTRAIETPGGLKVQTIHAFCERLLQRFPLEAGVPPDFTILDDATARALQREAIDGTLTEATDAPGSPLAEALHVAIAHAAEESFDEIVTKAMAEREWLDELERLAIGAVDNSLAAADVLYRRHLGIGGSTTRADLEAQQATVLRLDDLVRLRDVLNSGSANDIKCAALIAAAIPASGAARIDALASFFLTGKNELRKSLMTAKLKKDHPDLDDITQRAQDRFARAAAEMQALDALEATLAIVRLAGNAAQRYHDAKAQRAALDFDDLIRRTKSLLSDQNAADWVLFKLDGGLDHILVDESQDTSPHQWRVVEALAREFFAGTGAREEPRTLFAVGDEKQSIYSFQGAAPEMFALKGAEFAALAQQAGQPWRRVPLNLSFRTVAPILQAVDDVFADTARTPGVTAGAAPIAHVPRRFDQAGLVEIWPTQVHEDVPETDAWLPLDEPKRASPVTRLADRIAATIDGWLKSGERLTSTGQPVRPGDIIILVRKRQPFAGPMVAALKARGIPVAGADRLQLTTQIAVQDLIALGDFLTLPEDDLSLATVLKSPLFGLDDDDLVTITQGRKGTLWSALLAHAATSEAIAAAGNTLKQWRARADFAPPYEFFASILDKDGMRARLLARIGPEAADPLDEFMTLALTYDDSAPPSLAGFLVWLRETDREIKRDMEHGNDQVRIMTVHGAKGLEAPIVFLPDTCTTASGGTRGGLIELHGMSWPDAGRETSGRKAPLFWQVKGSNTIPAVRHASTAQAAKDTAERNRLLYVAMTRARDRLYVAGFEGKKGRSPGCWYDVVFDALERDVQRIDEPDGGTIWRLAAPQTGPLETPKTELQTGRDAEDLPAWATRPVPREPQLAVPLQPSRLAPYESDEQGEPMAPPPGPGTRIETPPAPPPAAMAGDARFLCGTLTHALLEHLPTLPQATWDKAAKAFIERRGAGLAARAKSSIAREALTILRDPAFAPLFGPASRPEVPIVAEIPRPNGVRAGPPLRLTGQIDRLAATDSEVLIIDYKTNRPPPQTPDGIAAVYLFQLAAYTLALRQIYPSKPVRAAILWTDGPRIMPIPAATIDHYISRLWDLDPASLDA